MANGVVKSKKLKRSLEDDNESRSVKRKTTHELQENGDKQIDIGSFLMNTAEGKLFLEILKVIAALAKKQCPLQPQNTTFTEAPANGNSENVNEEKNEVEASKKAVARDGSYSQSKPVGTTRNLPK
ncbi:hypothetical protein BTUL_0005g00900 [Botrytis tulipae]|uniref:Uncharacterized protein n=1 Tax=Botrytis tulipae TaxID=87230 RepID=A0A4Z1FCV5_9HELO|nr:hypothetical protein BTUL_0005g00900 [Botrytis tulipae]